MKNRGQNQQTLKQLEITLNISMHFPVFLQQDEGADDTASGGTDLALVSQRGPTKTV